MTYMYAMLPYTLLISSFWLCFVKFLKTTFTIFDAISNSHMHLEVANFGISHLITYASSYIPYFHLILFW
jgi:hypothetical protein